MGSLISTAFYLRPAARDPTGSNTPRRPKVREKGKAARPFIHQRTRGADAPRLPLAGDQIRYDTPIKLRDNGAQITGVFTFCST